MVLISKKFRFGMRLYRYLSARGKLNMFGVLMAQAMHETILAGDYKFSEKWKAPFGMRRSAVNADGTGKYRKRWWTKKVIQPNGQFSTYAGYDKWVQCFADRMGLDDYNGVEYHDNSQYLNDILSHGYATDLGYKSKVENLVSDAESLKSKVRLFFNIEFAFVMAAGIYLYKS